VIVGIATAAKHAVSEPGASSVGAPISVINAVRKGGLIIATEHIPGSIGVWRDSHAASAAAVSNLRTHGALHQSISKNAIKKVGNR
jgi:hypothetical protein